MTQPKLSMYRYTLTHIKIFAIIIYIYFFMVFKDYFLYSSTNFFFFYLFLVRGYDNHAKCGLVWIPHVVAYRCRTCGISPCMSICRNCFKNGDHSTHDFNMFLSQAGGACDCGDTSVMKAEGFCSDHGVNIATNRSPVPGDLLAVAEAVMPRFLLRLLHHFRDNDAEPQNYSKAAKDCDDYCSMLMELNNIGDVLRRVMTKALINTQVSDLLSFQHTS